MYNILEQLDHFKFNYEDDPEVGYLKESAIVDVINRGLADLYDSQPQYPINFLANWLLMESHGKEIKKMIEAEKKIYSATKKTVELKNLMLEEIKKQANSALKKTEDEKEVLLNKVKNCSNFETSLNDFCDGIQKITKSTGVYFGIYDKKRKPVKTDDDENAHLMNTKVIRYIGFCKDHDFLKFNFLEANEGVTYELFTPKSQQKKQNKAAKNDAEGNDDEEDENAANDEAVKKAKNVSESDANINGENNNETFRDINFVLINEVVRNPKIKYFREPRLGCYLAIEIAISSSLSSSSLNSAIESLISYKSKMKEYDSRREEYLKSKTDEHTQHQQDSIIHNSNKKNAEGIESDKNKDSGEAQNPNQFGSVDNENSNNKLNSSGANAQNISADGNNNLINNNGVKDQNNSNIDADTNADFPEENIVLKDYVRNEKKYVLFLDTLGQDRVYDLDEKKFISEISRIFKNSWEELEKTLLLKDRDLRMEQIEKENKLKEIVFIEKLENEEERYIKENITAEKEAGLEDSILIANFSELYKVRYMIYSILQETQMLELFKLISEYEVNTLSTLNINFYFYMLFYIYLLLIYLNSQ